MSHALVAALDPDRQVERARRDHGLATDAAPSPEQVEDAARALAHEATAVLATRPALRQVLQDVKREVEQVIDEVSKDTLLFAGASEEAKEKAKALVASFERYIEEHKDAVTALQFFYSVPHRSRLRYDDVKALAQAIQAPPRSWTPEKLWRAYKTLDRDHVRGASAKRLLTDIVSLVRFALRRDDELVPYAEQVMARFENWMAQQENKGRRFTPEQVHWIEMIRDHVAQSMEVAVEDFDYAPFAARWLRLRWPPSAGLSSAAAPLLTALSASRSPAPTPRP